MFLRSLLTLVFTLLTVSRVLAGGTSSNGGGGSVTNDMWDPLSNLSRRLQTPDVKKALADYLNKAVAEYPDLKFEKCAQDQLPIPQVPESFIRSGVNKFRFQLTTVEAKKPPVAATIEVLCKNRIWLEGYSTFVVSLHKVKDDPVILRLVDEAFRLSGAVDIMFVPVGRHISNKGGKIYEHTWFDPKTGQLFYASPPLSYLPSMEFFRRPHQLIRHELTHVLMKRVMGERYPKVENWHDASVTAFGDDLWNLSWLKAKTSESAAFIEGVANALERDDYYREHPHVLPNDELNELSYRKEAKTYCFDFIHYFKVDQQNRRLMPLLDNEIAVSTALSILFDHEDLSSYDKEEGPSLFRQPSVVSATDEKRQLQIIEALVRYAPMNLMDLARALDQVSGEDVGWRWYREFFYTDYRTGKPIDAELVVAQDFPQTIPTSKSVCLRDPKGYEKFYSPWAKQKQEEQRQEVKRANARAIKPDEVAIEAGRHAAEGERLLQKERLALGERFELALNAQAAAVRKVVACERGQTRESLEMMESLLSRINSRYNKGLFVTDLKTEDIVDYLDAGCRGDIGNVKSTIEKWQAAIDALKSLAQRASRPATESEHYQNVEEFYTLRHRLSYYGDEVWMYKRLTQILQDWGKS